jgi:hypothetical protein
LIGGGGREMVLRCTAAKPQLASRMSAGEVVAGWQETRGDGRVATRRNALGMSVYAHLMRMASWAVVGGARAVPVTRS